MTYASVSDVEVDYGPIPDDQVAKVETLLDRADARVRQVVKDIDDRIADGTADLVLVVQVESEMVAAVLRNPNCWQSQTRTEGPFSQSHTINLAAASGLLELTKRHRNLLGVRATAGSVAPTIGWPGMAGVGYPGYPDYAVPPTPLGQAGWD